MRLALLIAYDGTDFSGWWRQVDQPAVATVLDAACRRLGEPGEAVGASRTDAGVHARGQVAHLDLVRSWDPAHFGRCLNRHLPPSVRVRAAAPVADDWHAVHDVRHKTYRYRLDVRACPDPFQARFAWAMPVDESVLATVAGLVPGRRDWTALVRRDEWRADTVCQVLRCAWRHCGGYVDCRISADRFVYRMVRSLVGAMVQVGRGGMTEADFAAMLAGEQACPHQAPAQGLRLERIAYRHAPAWVPC